jgi:hypothetical protein
MTMADHCHAVVEAIMLIKIVAIKYIANVHDALDLVYGMVKDCKEYSYIFAQIHVYKPPPDPPHHASNPKHLSV